MVRPTWTNPKYFERCLLEQNVNWEILSGSARHAWNSSDFSFCLHFPLHKTYLWVLMEIDCKSTLWLFNTIEICGYWLTWEISFFSFVLLRSGVVHLVMTCLKRTLYHSWVDKSRVKIAFVSNSVTSNGLYNFCQNQVFCPFNP